MTRIKSLLPVLACLLLLAGCVSSLAPAARTELKPLAPGFEDMPYDAGAITAAVAAQIITPPLEQSGTVHFPPGTDLSPELTLGLQGFQWSDASLYGFTPAAQNAPGSVSGEIVYTDGLDRKARFLFRARYARDGEDYTVQRLELDRRSPETVRVAVTVVPARSLSGQRFATYAELVEFLAVNGVPASRLGASGEQDYAIYAVGMDMVPPGAEMSIAVSAKKAGFQGYAKRSAPTMLEGRWPVAVAAGKWNPSGSEALYAKVFIKQGDGFAAKRKLGTYKLTR